MITVLLLPNTKVRIFTIENSFEPFDREDDFSL